MLKSLSLLVLSMFISVKVMAVTVLNINFDEELPAGVQAKPPAADDSITLVPGDGRDGGTAAKIKILNSTSYVTDEKVRAEYNTLGNPSCSYKDGDEFTYQFSFKLDSSWVFDDRESVDIVWQFKRTTGQPDMFVAVKGKDLVMRISDNRQLVLISDIQKGVWADVKLHINFSKGEKGRVEASFKYSSDEEFELHADVGPNFRTREGGETYLKWGIYKPEFDKSILKKDQSHILLLDKIIVTKP
jgi:hypothetical protein